MTIILRKRKKMQKDKYYKTEGVFTLTMRKCCTQLNIFHCNKI